MPRECGWTLVDREDGEFRRCIVIAANGKLEYVKKAENLEIIRAVQKIVA
jgi:hypothetical protein